MDFVVGWDSMHLQNDMTRKFRPSKCFQLINLSIILFLKYKFRRTPIRCSLTSNTYMLVSNYKDKLKSN